MAPSPRSTDRPSLLTAAVVGIGFNPNAGCVWECPPLPPTNGHDDDDDDECECECECE